MSGKIVGQGLAIRSQMRQWLKSRQQEARRRVGVEMLKWAPSAVTAARADAAAGLKGNKAARSFHYKLYTAKANKMPALKIGSKIPWLGIHTRGGVIRGPLLVPIVKMSAKKLRNLIRELMKRGDGFWVRGDYGQVILMAENLPEYGGLLNRHKSAERKRTRSEYNSGRLKKGQAIPIAILLPQARLQKRINFPDSVIGEIPRLRSAINLALSRK